jgi:RNA recognition motif-containing protein
MASRDVPAPEEAGNHGEPAAYSLDTTPKIRTMRSPGAEHWAASGTPLSIHKDKRMNLFIGNLSREVTEADLRAIFEPFGKITTVTVVKDKFSGASKGFGFVEMAVKAEAEAAVTALHRTTLKGQSLDITEARPKEQRKQGQNNRGGGRRRSW